MSEEKCPYCWIKSSAKLKTVYEAIEPADGRCPDCGAYIDSGQHSVRVNGYKDIYKGCIRLIDGIVDEFNRILKDCDVDIKAEYGFEEDYDLMIYTSDIIEALFLNGYGGTTKRNFAKALDIDEDEHIWTLSKDEVEDD